MQEAKIHTTAVALSATGKVVEVKAQIIRGQAKAGMFLRIPLNGSLDVTAPIAGVTKETDREILLILDVGTEFSQILIALNFVGEELRVTEDG